jgi:hypothetical protein
LAAMAAMKMGQLQCHFFHKLIDPFLTDDDEDERIKKIEKNTKVPLPLFSNVVSGPQNNRFRSTS